MLRDNSLSSERQFFALVNFTSHQILVESALGLLELKSTMPSEAILTVGVGTFSSTFRSSLGFFTELGPLSSAVIVLFVPQSPVVSLLRFLAPCLSGAGCKLPGLQEALDFAASVAVFSVGASVRSLDPVALEDWVGQTVGLGPWGGVNIWAWAGCK